MDTLDTKPKELNVSWNTYDNYAAQLAMDLTLHFREVPANKILIIGMSRGGLPLAVHLSHLLELPMSILNYRRLDGINETTPELFHQHEHIEEYSHIVLVDDIHDSGHSMKICYDFLKEKSNSEIITASLIYNTHYHGEKKSEEVTFAGKVIDTSKEHFWINFPWEV